MENIREKGGEEMRFCQSTREEGEGRRMPARIKRGDQVFLIKAEGQVARRTTKSRENSRHRSLPPFLPLFISRKNPYFSIFSIDSIVNVIINSMFESIRTCYLRERKNI